MMFFLLFLVHTANVPPFPAEKPRTESAVSAGGSIPHPTSTRFIAFEELKEATNNFEPASVLGEGGFGKVFKGILSDGTSVAIKRLTSGGQQGDKEFLAEVEMLSRLHHRNLVKLVGYYSNRESSQNLLCYELVPNGSLEAWLHGNIIFQSGVLLLNLNLCYLFYYFSRYSVLFFFQNVTFIIKIHIDLFQVPWE
jgi:serine/threonine protein kinase